MELKYQVLGQEVPKEDVEKVLASRLRRHTDGSFDVFVTLPFAFEAMAVRTGRDGRFHDKARLFCNGKAVELSRDVDGCPGDIGFSCDPDGDDDVPIDTLNIKFRDYYDEHTARGIVWVSQGNPATAHLMLTREAVTSGKVAEILTQAEEALENKLLGHFKK